MPDPVGPGVRLRPATRADASVIRWLIWKARINPSGLDWRRFLVAVEAQGRVIGCGQVKPHPDGSRELASIAVEEAWRGQGVARVIIMRLQQNEAGPLYLTCRESLGPFYEKFGFEVAGEEDDLPAYFKRVRWLARHTPLIPGSLLIMRRRVILSPKR